MGSKELLDLIGKMIFSEGEEAGLAPENMNYYQKPTLNFLSS
jgi:hypothetical protein